MKAAICFLGISGFLTCAQADLVTFGFTGTVTQVPIDDVFGDIFAGDPFQGSYTFNSLALDLIPADTAAASFTSAGPAFAMTVTLAGHTFDAADFVNIGIFDSVVDQHTVLAQSGGSNLTVELFFQDNNGGALAGDLLPLAPPSLSPFAVKDFHLLQTLGTGEIQVDGQLDTLTCIAGCAAPEPTPVPEPSSAGLLLTGAGLLAALTARKR